MNSIGVICVIITEITLLYEYIIVTIDIIMSPRKSNVHSHTLSINSTSSLILLRLLLFLIKDKDKDKVIHLNLLKTTKLSLIYEMNAKTNVIFVHT